MSEVNATSATSGQVVESTLPQLPVPQLPAQIYATKALVIRGKAIKRGERLTPADVGLERCRAGLDKGHFADKPVSGSEASA